MLISQGEGLIWLDGQLVAWNEAQVHVLNYSLHYGMGVFEGVRAYPTQTRGTCIFRLEEHTKRLLRSARLLDIKVRFSARELNEAQRTVLRENRLSEAYLRPLCFYSSESMGLGAKDLVPHAMIACWDWPAYIDPQAQRSGIAMCTSSYIRHHPNGHLSQAKACGNYIDSVLALREAQQSGYEEAMLLDHEGYVSEGSGENIFVVSKGELCTPQLSSCLDGITRNTILTLARESGLKVSERSVTRDEVYEAEEMFLTGTAAEVLPVRSIDGRAIGSGARGPITEKLQTLYFQLVRGQLAEHGEWLSPIASDT